MNKTTLTVALAGGLALLAAPALAQDQAGTQTDQAEQTVVTAPHGMIAMPELKANNIRGTLAVATEEALTKDGLRGLAQRTTKSDRKRLETYLQQDQSDLNNLLERLHTAWRQKYGEDLTIDQNRSEVFDSTQVAIVEGIQAEAIQARAAEPPAAEETGDAPVVAEPGATQNEATAIFTSSHGMPQVAVPLIDEGKLFGLSEAWRIDVPITVDGPTFKQNLMTQIEQALAEEDQWPQEVNEARRKAIHSVMLALMGQPPTAEQAGDVQEQDQMHQGEAPPQDQQQPPATPQGQ